MKKRGSSEVFNHKSDEYEDFHSMVAVSNSLIMIERYHEFNHAFTYTYTFEK